MPEHDSSALAGSARNAGAASPASVPRFVADAHGQESNEVAPEYNGWKPLAVCVKDPSLFCWKPKVTRDRGRIYGWRCTRQPGHSGRCGQPPVPENQVDPDPFDPAARQQMGLAPRAVRTDDERAKAERWGLVGKIPEQ